VVAWNVPLFLACNKLGPALLAGCSVVLKPAAETPLSANALAEVFVEAGLPEGVLSVVPGGRAGGMRGGHFIATDRYDHYSVLRMIEDSLGLPTLTNNDKFAVPMNEFWN
jgi:acyl-CoA reductase-like NAD-dependent aldehyde dehydrogenase